MTDRPRLACTRCAIALHDHKPGKRCPHDVFDPTATYRRHGTGRWVRCTCGAPGGYGTVSGPYAARPLTPPTPQPNRDWCGTALLEEEMRGVSLNPWSPNPQDNV